MTADGDGRFFGTDRNVCPTGWVRVDGGSSLHGQDACATVKVCHG